MALESNARKKSLPPTLGWIACVALAVSPTQYAIPLPHRVHLCLADPLIWVAWGLWVWAIFRHRIPFRWTDVSLGGTLLVLWGIVSTVHSRAGWRGLVEVVQHAEYFLAAYLVFRATARDTVWRKRLLEVFVAVTAAILVVTVVQYLHPRLSPLQVSGTFGNRNVLGGYLSLALPLLAGLAAVEPSARRRIGLALMIAVGWATQLSGATFLALTTAFLGMAALRSPGALGVVALLLLLGSVTLLPHLPRHNAGTLADSIAFFDEAGLPFGRYPEWQAGARLVTDHALTGVGPGRYQSHIGAYYGTLPDRTGPSEPDTQNLYLVLAGSLGLPGLLAWGSLLIAALGRAVRAYVRSHPAPESGLAIGAFGGLVAFMINALWAPLLVRGIGIPLALLLSFAAVAEEEPPA